MKSGSFDGDPSLSRSNSQYHKIMINLTSNKTSQPSISSTSTLIVKYFQSPVKGVCRTRISIP